MLSAEAFHEGNAVEVPRQESSCGHGHSHTTQQHADERRQNQKTLGALDRPAHDWPAIADVLELLVDAEKRFELLAKSSDRALGAGKQELILDDTAGLDQPCCLDIGVVEQQRRCDLHEPPTFVGPELQCLRNPQRQLTNLELVSDVGTESREQTGLGPDLASHGNALGAPRCSCELVRNTHFAAKRVTFGDAAHVR